MCSSYPDYEDLLNSVCEFSSALDLNIHSLYNHYETLNNTQKSDDSVTALATCEYYLGNLKSAQTLLSQLSSLPSPQIQYSSHLLHGLLFQKQEISDQSLQSFISASKIQNVSPRKPFILHNLILDELINTQKFLLALEYFESIKEVPQDSCLAYLKVGFCYEQLNNTQEAVRCYSMFESYKHKLAPICALWTSVLLNKDVLEQFENCFATLTGESDLLSDCKYLKALYLIKTNQYEESIRLLKEICASSAKDFYCSALGYCYFKSNNLYQSFIYTLKSLKSNPKLAESWLNLAAIYKRVQQPESEFALQKAQNLGLGVNLTANTLQDPILPKLELWKLGLGVNTKPIKKRQNPSKPSEPCTIIVPTAVKSENLSKGFSNYTPSVFSYMYLMQEFLKRKPEIQSEEENKELAKILSHMTLPSKRTRSFPN